MVWVRDELLVSAMQDCWPCNVRDIRVLAADGAAKSGDLGEIVLALGGSLQERGISFSASSH